MTPEDERRRHLHSIADPVDHPGDDQGEPPLEDDPGESQAWAQHPSAGQQGQRDQQRQQASWPEHDPTAEAHVLSALITAAPRDHASVEAIMAVLAPTDFYDGRHETIYHAVLAVHARGAGIDPVAVATQLRNAKALTEAGGHAYIAELVGLLGSPTLAEGHAQSLLRYSERRAAKSLGHALLNAAEHADEASLSTRVADHLSAGAARLTPRGSAISSWTPMDLTGVLSGEITTVMPAVLARADGEHLLYPGKVHSISGEPGSGKSWLAILGVAQALLEGQAALYCDFEDRPQTLIERLRALGVADDAIASLLRYVRPEQALDPSGELALLRAAADCPLAIVDGVTEAMGLHGLEMNDNTDVARFLAMLPRRIADVGPAVLQVDHVVKNAEARGRYAIGGQHKLAGIDGVAYKAVVAKPMARGIRGSTRIVIDKDRGGYVGPTGMTAAELILDATAAAEGGTTYLWADVPAPEMSESGDFRPTGLMEKVSRFLEINPGVSGRNVTEVVKGKQEHVKTALQMLVAEGYVSVVPGPHRSTLHYLDRPYRESEDR